MYLAAASQQENAEGQGVQGSAAIGPHLHKSHREPEDVCYLLL